DAQRCAPTGDLSGRLSMRTHSDPVIGEAQLWGEGAPLCTPTSEFQVIQLCNSSALFRWGKPGLAFKITCVQRSAAVKD
ncbi:MAG TPA: hypothetical protein V6C88_02065, partial [Chroococcidiopsis sp.]